MKVELVIDRAFDEPSVPSRKPDVPAEGVQPRHGYSPYLVRDPSVRRNFGSVKCGLCQVHTLPACSAERLPYMPRRVIEPVLHRCTRRTVRSPSEGPRGRRKRCLALPCKGRIDTGIDMAADPA